MRDLLPNAISLPAVGCLAAALLLGCGGPAPSSAPPASADAPTPPPAPPAPPLVAPGDGLTPLLGMIDTDIAFRRKLAVDQPTGAWLPLEHAALGKLVRARLVAGYDDYAAAEALIEEAFVSAPKGQGPFSTRALVNLKLHRLDRVEPDLLAVEGWPEVGNHSPAAVLEAWGALETQRGDHPAAEARLRAALEMKPRNPGPLSGLARLRWLEGDFEAAEALYVTMLEKLPGQAVEPRAWVHLQLGQMDLDRGRARMALGHFRDADNALPGYWLVHEHIAESLTLLGDVDDAVALYERVIEATGGAPEFLDALAAIRRAQGDEAAATALVERARAGHEAHLARYPEATYGHALDHFLEFGPVGRAVELAEKNHAVRPNTAAKTKLATAYLQAKRGEDAAKVMREALAGPVRTAELHARASEAFAAVGDAEGAARQRAAAIAIDPTSP